MSKRILVVEDQPDSRQIIRDMLTGTDYEITEAENGEEAASSDRLRERARCTSCGNKGATIQHPGWGGNDVGFLPFPT
jgi:hypothetical protein